MEGHEYEGHGPGIVMLVGGVIECVIGILFRLSKIESLWIPGIAAFLIGLVCIIMHCFKIGGKGFFSGICTMVIMCMVFLLAVAGTAGTQLVFEQIENDKKAKAVTAETSGYIREFGLEGSDYWCSPGMDKVVRIRRNKLMVEYEELPIAYDTETIDGYMPHMSSFYLMNENSAFSDSYDATSFCLWTGEKTDQFLFRVRNENDEIGYVPIKISDFEGFISGFSCVQYKREYDGSVIFYLRPRSVFDDKGQPLPEEGGGYMAEYTKDGVHTEIRIGRDSLPYIITTTKDGLKVSDVTNIVFDAEYDFNERISAFVDSHTQMRIEELQKKVKSSVVPATEKKNAQSEIKELQGLAATRHIELVNEAQDDHKLKLYRVVYDLSYEALLPEISIVEIKMPDGSYKYGYTDLTPDYLYQLMPDRSVEAETAKAK